jgi:hypothetical protein
VRPRPRVVAGMGLSMLVLTLASCEKGVTGPENDAQLDPSIPLLSHGTGTNSGGVYRIPYVNGSSVKVTRDHHDHEPVNRIDMAGDVAGLEIVAAASGTIRAIVDRHGDTDGRGDDLSANQSQPHDDSLEHSCQDDDTVIGDCSDYNNYVWIEHPNGEWTKYTHFRTLSVTDNGWQVGDWINVGEVLGIEGDIGAASGRHLHWEVGLPTDPDDLTPFSSLGGFMVSNFGINLIPQVCDIPNLLYETDEWYTANPCDNDPPTADAGGPYTVDEGSTVLLDGSGSTDPDGLQLTYLWQPGANLSDSTVAGPTFLGVDDGVVNLKLFVWDQVEALGDSATTTVTVSNVDPAVTIDAGQVTTIDEGDTLLVSATFSDPGVDDAPFTAEVVCYDLTGYSLTVDGTVTVTSDDGPVEGTITAYCPFGDTSQAGEPLAGTFEVTVSLTDKDGGSDEASFEVTVRNGDPDPEIDDSGAIDINGTPTFIAAIGEDVDFNGSVTDRGSDDLFLTWDWDDGSTDQETDLLAVGGDPFPSPSMSPRDIGDQQSHTWTDACSYTISLTAADDDGGEGAAEAAVIIAGKSGRARGVGYWLPQYRNNRSNALSAGTLTCYLEIAEHLSSVFDEDRAGTGSFAEATSVLTTAGSQGDMTKLLDRQLLGAWLNFANGAFGWTQPVDTDGDLVPDVPFSAAISTAETVRLDANASRAELEEQKNILEAINLMHGG